MSLRLPAYVKNDTDLMRFFERVQKRTERYPNWRQVYLDCFGLCQYPVNAEMICGNPDTLEFHESYDNDGKIIQIVLVCNYHHFFIHNGICNPRHYPSKLQLDIEIESKLCGGLPEWIKKYGLIEREVQFDFANDNGEVQADLQFSENE
jgi:hypothetical protein